MSIIEKAKNIATIAHLGQKYGTGEDYIIHPKQVAKLAEELGYHEYVIAACWLHDVLEDSDINEEQLRKEFPDIVVDAVVSVTYDGSDHFKKIQRAMRNPVGHVVKLFDATCNMSNVALFGPKPGKTYKEVFDRYYAYLQELTKNIPKPSEVDDFINRSIEQ